MKRKIYLKISAISIILVLSITILTGCSSGKVRVSDNADLFSDEEIEQIEEKISSIEKSSLCDYFVITKVDASGGMYNSHYELKNSELQSAGVNKYDDNTVLLILTDGNGNYCYHIYTHGDSYDAIDNIEFDLIWDSLKSIEDGQFLEPALTFVTMSADAYNNTNNIVVHYVSHILFAFILSLIAAGITVGVIASKYKLKIKPENYPVDKYCNLELTRNEDVFKGTFVSRRPISKNRGGSRGGGGGGGVTFGGSSARR